MRTGTPSLSLGIYYHFEFEKHFDLRSKTVAFRPESEPARDPPTGSALAPRARLNPTQASTARQHGGEALLEPKAYNSRYLPISPYFFLDLKRRSEARQ